MFVLFFQLFRDNEHRPWMFESPEATTRVYRQWVDVHQSLSAYLLSAGTLAYASGNSTVRPVAPKVTFLVLLVSFVHCSLAAAAGL
jgi:hypothetical protein